MSRTRAYTRKMRAKHIKRKKRIVSNWRQFDDYGFYKFDGMFSKNKIHCSCPLCKSKAYYGKHVPTEREVMSLMRLKEELQIYNDAFGVDYEIKPKTITTYSTASGDWKNLFHEPDTMN